MLRLRVTPRRCCFVGSSVWTVVVSLSLVAGVIRRDAAQLAALSLPGAFLVPSQASSQPVISSGSWGKSSVYSEPVPRHDAGDSRIFSHCILTSLLFCTATLFGSAARARTLARREQSLSGCRPTRAVACLATADDDVGTSLSDKAILKTENCSEVPKEGHVDIGQLLARYGLTAVMFHFAVWITCLTSCYLALSSGAVNLNAVLNLLPEALRPPEGAAQAPVALAVCEFSGPARTALTLAVTPALASAMRRKVPGETSLWRQFEAVVVLGKRRSSRAMKGKVDDKRPADLVAS